MATDKAGIGQRMQVLFFVIEVTTGDTNETARCMEKFQPRG